MGSLNQDGSKISQSRETVRNVGGSHIVSADRVESEVIRERAPEAASDDLGTNADLTTSQYSTVSLSDVQKITQADSDEVVSREIDREEFTPDPDHQPREWYGLATAGGAVGGGSQDLESVLEQGNTGSGIVLSELLITPRIMPDANTTDGIYISYDDSDETHIFVGEYIDIHSNKRFYIRSNTTCDFVSDEIRLMDRSSYPVLTATPTKVMAYVPLNSRRDVEVVTIPSGGEITLSAAYEHGPIRASGQVIIVKGSGPRTVRLPDIKVGFTPPPGLIYDIKDGDGTSSSGNITIVSDRGNYTIDGQSEFVIDVNYASYTFLFNGTEWNLI